MGQAMPLKPKFLLRNLEPIPHLQKEMSFIAKEQSNDTRKRSAAE